MFLVGGGGVGDMEGDFKEVRFVITLLNEVNSKGGLKKKMCECAVVCVVGGG